MAEGELMGDDAREWDADLPYTEAYHEYCAHLERLADEIAVAIHEADGTTLNGRAWCESKAIPERMFAHAVEQHGDRFDYGISPMHPWVIDDE